MFQNKGGRKNMHTRKKRTGMDILVCKIDFGERSKMVVRVGNQKF
jgi:hypothetical protein